MIGGKRLKDLDHTDDLCLFAKDSDKIKLITELVGAEASFVGLKINTRKNNICQKTIGALQLTILFSNEAKNSRAWVMRLGKLVMYGMKSVKELKILVMRIT